MIGDRRGLSAIIVTLIMILLVIVASGIIWVVIRNVVGSNTEQINLGTDCLNVEVQATRVANTTLMDVTPVTYDVTLTRSAGGIGIGGVSLIFHNASGTETDVVTSAGNIAPQITTTRSVNSTITNANKVGVTVYFTDTSGKQQDCKISREFEFSL